MKKTFLPLLLVFVLLFSFASFAADNDCICGRHYITDSADENSLYCCEKCGRNYLLCTCDCFCGAEATTSSDENGTAVKICSGCEKSTVECTCKDRETVLGLEDMQRNGTLSSSAVRFPKTVISSFIAAAVIVSVLVFSTFAKRKKEEQTPETPEKALDPGFENYRLLHTAYEELSDGFPKEIYPGDPDAVCLSRQDVELFKKALIGEETDISYFLNIISQKLLDSALFPTEKGLHVAKLLYEKEETYRIGFGIYETVRLFKDGDRFDARLEQSDRVLVYLSMTPPDAAALLRKCIAHRPKRDFELEKTNVTLDKNEFLLFLYVIYSDLPSFRFEDLTSKETLSVFAKKTRGPENRHLRKTMETLLKDAAAIRKAFDGLAEKRVFAETDFDVYVLKENIKTDFSPEKFMNVVYFEEVENGKETFHINFVLSGKGGVALFEKDGMIKIVSSFTIPWSHYIK